MPPIVKQYAVPVLAFGGTGAMIGAGFGKDPETGYKPWQGALVGGAIGATLGGLRANIHYKFNQNFGKGYTHTPIGKITNLTDDLKTLKLVKGKIKTKTQVKKQYRNLARRYHPDMNPRGEEKFKEIARSWENIQQTNWFQKLASMKYLEKTSKYKTWDEKFSFTDNLTSGAAIGSALGALGAKVQTDLIKKKLKTVKEIKMIRPNILRMSIVGGILGGVAGLGKHFYEQEHYTE